MKKCENLSDIYKFYLFQIFAPFVEYICFCRRPYQSLEQ